MSLYLCFFFFSSRRRHTRLVSDWSSDVCSSDLGTGGGTLVGAVFSHVVRGFGIGLAGSAVYVMARKGKDVELPAQTGILVRMDNTITVPSVVPSNASYNTSR